MYKDEYLFTSTHDERNFDEDQRRTKELRRQQYNNRNSAKIREVIIFKIEYLKRRATQILEKWFESNTHGMNQAEILKHSQELQVDPDTFQKMHDVFVEDKTLFGKQTEELNKIIYKDNEKQEIQQKVVKKKPEPTTPTSSRRGKSARKVEKFSSPLVSKSEVPVSHPVVDKKVHKHSQVVQKDEQQISPVPSSVQPVEEQLRTKESDAWKRALVAINKEKDAQRKAEEARVLRLKNENEELRLKLNEEYRRAQEEANIYQRLRQEAEEEASRAEKARREAEIIRSQAEVEAALLKIAATREANSHREEVARKSAQSSSLRESSNPRNEEVELRKSQESKDLWRHYEPEVVAAEKDVYLNQAEQDGSEYDDNYRRPLDHDESEVPSPHSGKKESPKSISSIDQESNQKSAQEVHSSNKKSSLPAKELVTSPSNEKAGSKSHLSTQQEGQKQDQANSKTLNAMAKHLQNQQANRRSADSRTQRVEQDIHKQKESEREALNAQQAAKQREEFNKAVHSIAKSQRIDKTATQDAHQQHQETKSKSSKATKQEADSSQHATHSQAAQEASNRSNKDSVVAQSTSDVKKHTKEVSDQNRAANTHRESNVTQNGKEQDSRAAKSTKTSTVDRSIAGTTNNISKTTADSTHRDKTASETNAKDSTAKDVRDSRTSRVTDSTAHVEADKKEHQSDKRVEASKENSGQKTVDNISNKTQDVQNKELRQNSQEKIDSKTAITSDKVRDSQQKLDESRTSTQKEDIRNSTVSNSGKDQTKRRDLNARKQEVREVNTKKDVTQEADATQTSTQYNSGNAERRRVSERGINKLIEKKLEEAQQTKETDTHREEAIHQTDKASKDERGVQKNDLRQSLRDSRESLKQHQQKQDSATSSAVKDQKKQLSDSLEKSHESRSNPVLAEHLQRDEAEADSQRGRSSAFRIEAAGDKKADQSNSRVVAEEPKQRVFTEAEVQELLLQREKELEALHREDLQQATRRTVEDVIQKKDSVREVCREQLWAKFLQYCETELPHDEEFQRHLMNQTFLYFLDKHVKGDPRYFAEIEERCNQLIREDRSED